MDFMSDNEMFERIRKATYDDHEWLMEVAAAPLISNAVRFAAGGKAAEQLTEHRYFMELYKHAGDKRLPQEVRNTMKMAAEAVLSRDTDSELKSRAPEKFRLVMENRRVSSSAWLEFGKDIAAAKGIVGMNLRKN